jgi:hypothetical protein
MQQRSQEAIMRRREAIKVSIGSTVAAPWIWRSIFGIGATVSLTGCDGKWEDIIKYCTVGLDSAKRVVDILVASQVITTKDGTTVGAVLDKIQFGFNDVRVAVQQYIDAPESQKATLADKALVAMQALADNILAFWNDLQIPDPNLAATISALLTLIVSTLQGYVVWGASKAERPLPRPRAARGIGPARAPVPAKERSVSEFRDEFNAILEKRGYGKYTLK